MPSKQKLFLLVLVALLSPLQLYCQKPGSRKSIQESPDVEFQGENVISWHANLRTNSRIFPLISVMNKQVAFQGTTKKILALPERVIKTEFATDGSSICIISVEQSQKQGNSDQLLILQFYSAQGELIFEANRNHAYDEPIPNILVLNENKGFVLGNSAIGKLWFHNFQGKLVNEVELFQGSRFDLERVLTMDASRDAQVIAVLATKRSASPQDADVLNPSGEPTLFTFTVEGNQIWSRALAESTGGEITVSPHGRYFLAGSYSWDSRGGLKRAATLFDDHGEIIKSYDFLFQTTSFSFTENYLLMADRQTVKAVELPSGNQVWRCKIKRDDGFVMALETGKDLQTSFVLVGKDAFRNGAFVFVDTKLLVLNQLGKSIQTLDFPEREFVNPALFISPGAETVGVGFRDVFFRFNVLQ